MDGSQNIETKTTVAVYSLERVEQRGDLFAPVLELEQELPGLDRLG